MPHDLPSLIQYARKRLDKEPAPELEAIVAVLELVYLHQMDIRPLLEAHKAGK